jgi:hypothetical protein
LGDFGAPSQLLSDRGSQLLSDRGSHFVNEVITEFTSLVGTQQCLTLAYSSQQKSIVERVNKKINRHIRSLTFESNSVEDYQFTLLIVQRILNAAYSDRAHLSSSQILFGNAINLDRSLFLPPVERPTQGHPLSVHMSKMLKFQDEVMERARTILQESDNLHTASSSAKIPTTFLPETYVLVKYRNSSNLSPAPTWLHTYWKGPFKEISNVLSEYLLLDLITDKQKLYHVSDMKPFVFDPINTNPLDLARRDYLEFFMEKILAMSGDVKKVSTLDFHIKWLGYDDTYNLWLPWKDLRETDILHSYLRQNNLGNLIPKKFFTPTV